MLLDAVEPLEALTAWVVSQLKNASGGMVGLCIPALIVLMDAYESRMSFSKSGGLKYMSRQLKTGTKNTRPAGDDSKKKFGQASVQQLYELTFCMWILTYELNSSNSIRSDFAKDGLAVTSLVELVSLAPREKVVRVALSSLRNLATCDADEDPAPAGTTRYDGKFFLSDMIACGLMKAISLLRQIQNSGPSPPKTKTRYGHTETVSKESAHF